MKEQIGTYLHILDRKDLSDGTQILHVEELPPPYRAVERPRVNESDWNDEIIEIQPLQNHVNKYGFVISGGIDTENSPAIVITHIDYCPKTSFDNGRSKLRVFDRLLAINNISLTGITHDDAVHAFSSCQGQTVLLHIRRLNPVYIEHIDIKIPSDIANQSLGITVTGGLDNNIEDPGLFISNIDPHGFLASITKNNELRIGDRLLEIKTNYTSANLHWVTHSMGVQLIRRTCQDNSRVTLIVAHRTLTF